MPKHLNRPNFKMPGYPWDSYIESIEAKVNRLQNELDKMRAAAQQPSLFGGDEPSAVTAPTLEMGSVPATGHSALFDEDPSANALGGFTAESEESRKAALANYPRSGNQRHKILLAVFRKGPHGMTFDECREEIGIYSADRRMSELVDGGWLERTGRARITQHGADASVMTCTQKAVEWIRTRDSQVFLEAQQR